MIAQPPLLWLIDTLISLYVYLLFASAIFSWMLCFGIANPRHQIVAMLVSFLHQATEPVLRPIRRILPSLGGLDLSPAIVIFALFFIQYALNYYWPR